MKTCNTCEQVKPLTEYWKNSYALDGHAHRCAECSKAYKRSEEYKAKRRATRNLVKNRESCRRYAAQNREKIANRQKAYNSQPEVKEAMKVKRRERYIKGGKQRALEGIKNLSDNYVKAVLVKDTSLSYTVIPKAMIEAKRFELAIRRDYIENTTPEERARIARKKAYAKGADKRKAYMLASKEARAQYAKEYAEKHKEAIAAKNKAYKEANRERTNALARARYDPEKQSVKGKAYREKYREELNAKAKTKYAENKEEINAKRRNITPEQRAHINALAREAVKRRKLKINQEGVAK